MSATAGVPTEVYGSYWTPGPTFWVLALAVATAIAVPFWLDLRRKERRQERLLVREREMFTAFKSAAQQLEEYIADDAPRKRTRRAAVAVIQTWSDWQALLGRHDDQPRIVQQAGRLALLLTNSRKPS